MQQFFKFSHYAVVFYLSIIPSSKHFPLHKPVEDDLDEAFGVLVAGPDANRLTFGGAPRSTVATKEHEAAFNNLFSVDGCQELRLMIGQSSRLALRYYIHPHLKMKFLFCLTI